MGSIPFWADKFEICMRYALLKKDNYFFLGCSRSSQNKLGLDFKNSLIFSSLKICLAP
jgi:hypothetical protein